MLVMVSGGPTSADDAPKPDDLDRSIAVERAVTLDTDELTESSGLAFSRRRQNRLWSHNDSGGQPILYAFDTSGRETGRCELDVTMVDWEDIAAFSDAGYPQLLVADCGDNQSIRDSITLYLFDEPDPDGITKTESMQVIEVSYPNGPCNCEAIAIDLDQRQILLIAKTTLSPAIVYSLPLPARMSNTNDNGQPSGVKRTKVMAREIKRLILPLVTGMDFDPSTGDVWVTSYFQAFRFHAAPSNRDLSELFGRQPQPIALPRWKQIEAIAVDSESRVWVTSEGVPAMLGKLSNHTEPQTQQDFQE